MSIAYLVKLHFFEAVVSLLFIVHVKYLKPHYKSSKLYLNQFECHA